MTLAIVKMALLKLLFLMCVVSFAQGNAANIIKPCKLGDDACITNSVKASYPRLIAGIPTLNIEPSDPMYLELINVDLSTMKLKLKNNTITGWSNCEVGKVKFDLDESLFSVDLMCDKLHMRGQYDVSGRLIIIPIEGNGDHDFKSKKFLVGVDAEIKKVEGKDGKSHLSIKKFKLRLQALEKFDIQLSNLFNGQKDLANAVITFADQNWREILDLVKEPMFTPVVKKIVNNANKYLKTVPFEDLVLE